jgi:hypothetical protein
MAEKKPREPKAKAKVWKKQMKKPLPKWHVHQGNSNDCGPFCVTMIVNGMRDADIVNPEQLARKMESSISDRQYLLPQRIKGWATFPWGVVNALKELGYDARWQIGTSIERLKLNLDADRPTVVVIGEPLAYRNKKYVGWSHYKILYAYDDEEWAFVDPLARPGVIYSYQDMESFKKQWSNMGRIIIEVFES